jgi:hypothetical protein
MAQHPVRGSLLVFLECIVALSACVYLFIALGVAVYHFGQWDL